MHNAFQNSSHDHGPCLMTSSLVLLITKVKIHEMTLNKLKLKKLCENKLSFAPQKNQLMGSFFYYASFWETPYYSFVIGNPKAKKAEKEKR